MPETATTVAGGQSVVRRRTLLLHDGLTFLTLLVVSLVLYGVTFFLFQSFEAHRQELGRRWSARGEAALQAGHPKDAIVPLRAAISYAPDDTNYQMLLAQALAGAGKREEATNYFLNLWEARPGDGFINLQLARLARARGDASQATEYYRAAVFGVWQENALEQRRLVRVELADYLLQLHDSSAARAELLITAANAPDTVSLDLGLGDALQRAGDPQDAMNLYEKAVARSPKNRAALEKAGSAAFALGNYATAARLLIRAHEAKASAGASGMSNDRLDAMMHESNRMVELSLSRDLPASVRADHLLVAGAIAQARLSACVAKATPSGLPAIVSGAPGAPASSTGTAGTTLDPPAPQAPSGQQLAQSSPLLSLRAQWKAATTPAARKALREDAGAQDQRTELIFDTEEQTAASCGTPTGDDALLLKMAQAARAAGQQGRGD